MIRRFLRFWLIGLAYGLSKLMFKLSVSGMENLPTQRPLIIISNHFSWFEASLIFLHLPFKEAYYMAATELQAYAPLRLLFYTFNSIPVWRGQVDRQALSQALAVLKEGGILTIFPEGGIDPDLQETIQSGQTTQWGDGRTSRSELIAARPGVAYLAATSGALILPVAFLGTEHTLANLKRFRRTAVTMTIGTPFGPLPAPHGLHGTAKRNHLHALGHHMMYQLAELLPAENRGYYASEASLLLPEQNGDTIQTPLLLPEQKGDANEAPLLLQEQKGDDLI